MPLEIGGTTVTPGARFTAELPIANLYTRSPLTMPVHVLSGRKSGPTVFVSAAVHGDELNGVEIIRRLRKMTLLKRLRGTLLLVPIVNVHGFINRSRYLPDRRDLNRSFPGRESGSLASRVAYGFVNEIVSKCDYGIDLHTGAIHRSNLPQIRANLSDPAIRDLAIAFNAPLMLDSSPVEGTLRDYTSQNQIPLLLYEAGEALRLDEACIRVGLQGVVNVLRKLDMLPATRKKSRERQPVIASSSQWVRADASGVLRTTVGLGEHVQEGQVLAFVSDTVSEHFTALKAPYSGLVIGRLNLPLVFEGEAVFHIARTGKAGAVAEAWEKMQAIDDHPEPLTDDPPIV